MKKRSSKYVDVKTLGLDLGDRWTHFCGLDDAGKVVARGRVRTTPAHLGEFLGEVPPCRVAMEVGSASPWVSRLATEAGHETVVDNARELKLI